MYWEVRLPAVMVGFLVAVLPVVPGEPTVAKGTDYPDSLGIVRFATETGTRQDQKVAPLNIQVN
ncbi:hypothetical protein GCM10028868_18880 [Virgibacillus kimchii]